MNPRGDTGAGLDLLHGKLPAVQGLLTDNQVNNDEWEKLDILSYLDGISSWVKDMEGYYKNVKIDIPANIDWKFIATLFYVGKIYE